MSESFISTSTVLIILGVSIIPMIVFLLIARFILEIKTILTNQNKQIDLLAKIAEKQGVSVLDINRIIDPNKERSSNQILPNEA